MKRRTGAKPQCVRRWERGAAAEGRRLQRGRGTPHECSLFSLFRRLFVGAVGAAGRAGARGGGGLLSPPWLRATQHLCVLGVSGS